MASIDVERAKLPAVCVHCPASVRLVGIDGVQVALVGDEFGATHPNSDLAGSDQREASGLVGVHVVRKIDKLTTKHLRLHLGRLPDRHVRC
jgi:hypothetical protein